MENHKLVLKPKALVDKDQAWARLKQKTNKVGKRHREITEEDVEKDVLEAIKAVRSE